MPYTFERTVIFSFGGQLKLRDATNLNMDGFYEIYYKQYVGKNSLV